MQFSVAELPLALFTTLAPLGAGAFIALACAFFTTSFSDEQKKKIDRGTIIPLVIVIIGFICAFFERDHRRLRVRNRRHRVRDRCERGQALRVRP